MTNTIKLISWNIENFGKKKRDGYFPLYVSTVIKQTKADIVGFIEVVGETGDLIAAELKSYMPGWEALVSDQFMGGGNLEQYILMYNTAALRRIGNYGLVGYVNNQDFEGIWKDLGISDNDEEITKFNDTLIKNKYLDDWFRVPRKTWVLLNRGEDVSVDEITTDPAILAKMKNVLLRAKPYVFPRWVGRTPFYAQFSLPNGEPLSVYLFHAPKPASGQDNDVYYGVNHLGLVSELANDRDIVIMGDFNITYKQIDDIKIHYERMNDEWKMVNTGEWVTPFQTLTGPDVAPYSFLSYVKQLDNVGTSLVKQNPKLDKNPDKPSEAYSEAYDNFYFKKKVLSGPKSQRLNVLENLQSNMAIRLSGVEIYDCWRKEQLKKVRYKKKKFPYPEIDSSEKLTFRNAFLVYRCAVSDHVPVSLALDYS